MIDLGQFEIDNTGQYFTVLIYDDLDLVAKLPREDAVNDWYKLEEIANAQTYLSERVEGILPCWHVNNYLVMPKAPGIRFRDIASREKKAALRRDKLQKIKDAILDHGYILYDIGENDTFYDPETGQVTVVDFHQIRKMPGE